MKNIEIRDFFGQCFVHKFCSVWARLKKKSSLKSAQRARSNELLFSKIDPAVQKLEISDILNIFKCLEFQNKCLKILTFDWLDRFWKIKAHSNGLVELNSMVSSIIKCYQRFKSYSRNTEPKNRLFERFFWMSEFFRLYELNLVSTNIFPETLCNFELISA